MSGFKRAEWLNEAGNEKNRGLVEIEFNNTGRMKLKAETDQEAQVCLMYELLRCR
jgi:hypothetical protein